MDPYKGVPSELRAYAMMRQIRAFEETAVDFAREGLVPGFTHTCIGQEAVAAGVCLALRDDDRVGSNHRGHGHVLARGADPKAMFSEMLGKASGCLKGMGGELHILDASRNIIGANGIVGAGIPIAVGAALADQLAGDDRVTVVFFGEGASNEGVFAEAMNLAAAWRLPVVFVCENNRYSEFTPSADVCAGQIADRASGYGMPGSCIDGQDVAIVTGAAEAAVDLARGGGGPSLIEAATYRFQGHFYGEEALLGKLRYRAPEEVVEWRETRDPVVNERARLIKSGAAAAETLDALDASIEDLLGEAADFARAAQMPDPEQALEYVFGPGAEVPAREVSA
jgi:pyruvate dehydrogenase E1 component alpha subunit